MPPPPVGSRAFETRSLGLDQGLPVPHILGTGHGGLGTPRDPAGGWLVRCVESWNGPDPEYWIPSGGAIAVLTGPGMAPDPHQRPMVASCTTRPGPIAGTAIPDVAPPQGRSAWADIGSWCGCPRRVGREEGGANINAGRTRIGGMGLLLRAGRQAGGRARGGREDRRGRAGGRCAFQSRPGATSLGPNWGSEVPGIVPVP